MTWPLGRLSWPSCTTINACVVLLMSRTSPSSSNDDLLTMMTYIGCNHLAARHCAAASHYIPSRDEHQVTCDRFRAAQDVWEKQNISSHHQQPLPPGTISYLNEHKNKRNPLTAYEYRRRQAIAMPPSPASKLSDRLHPRSFSLASLLPPAGSIYCHMIVPAPVLLQHAVAL